MSLRANLKLELSKSVRKITLKYNTFEKVTFDEYLITSLALHCMSDDDAFQYIDDITGSGSLNDHFRKLYDSIVKFSKEQKERILQTSMFPILKIDESNTYEYYPQLNISVFNKNVYIDDIGGLPDEELASLLLVKEKVLDIKIEPTKETDNAEPYEVCFDDDGGITVKIQKKQIKIKSELFENILVKEPVDMGMYNGVIHSHAEGNGWIMLNKSVVNSLFESKKYFYDSGNHCLIRNDNIRCTEVAKLSGLYICRQTFISYEKNSEICKKALSVIWKNNDNTFKPTLIEKLLRNVDEDDAIRYIELIYNHTYSIPKEVATFIIELLRKGKLVGWSSNVLTQVMKHCPNRDYSIIYSANQDVSFTIEQLLLIDKNILNEKHFKQVEEYLADLNKMKDTIKGIIGDIASSGLREKVKSLNSDKKTKRFSKLCNQLIGHVDKDLNIANKQETEQWLKDALELKDLAETMRQRLEINN